MFQPSPQLCARLRFTTKQVGRGFYRGNRTGSKGAHTAGGGYIIDWRKTTHYNVPEIENFYLTPFVSLEMEPTPRVRQVNGTLQTPEKVDGLDFLREWKRLSPFEYEHLVEHQEQLAAQAAQTQAELAQEAVTQQEIGSQVKSEEHKAP
ncbi:60S ribosomal protein L27, mitochondrial [Exophiala xenobiotica]|nr:60S ribosomal protein L27, mitochondrial [Exophiala xenobiotica]